MLFMALPGTASAIMARCLSLALTGSWRAFHMAGRFWQPAQRMCLTMPCGTSGQIVPKLQPVQILFPVVGADMTRQKSGLSRVQGWRFFCRIQAKKYYPSLDSPDRRSGCYGLFFNMAMLPFSTFYQPANPHGYWVCVTLKTRFREGLRVYYYLPPKIKHKANKGAFYAPERRSDYEKERLRDWNTAT